MTRKILSVILALMLVLTLTVPAMAASVDTTDTAAVAEQSAVLTFSNSGVTETQAGSGYAIDGTTLTMIVPSVHLPYRRQLHRGNDHRQQGAEQRHAHSR